MTTEDERTKFYFAIGFAISQWAHVEAALARAFARFTGARDSFAANAAFFAAVNFNTKLEMTSAAAALKFLTQSNLLAEWNSIAKKVHKKSKVRNNFAHFTCIVRANKGDKYRYYLAMSALDNNSILADGSPSYNHLNIMNEAHAFAELAEGVTDFLDKVIVLQPPAQL